MNHVSYSIWYFIYNNKLYNLYNVHSNNILAVVMNSHFRQQESNYIIVIELINMF